MTTKITMEKENPLINIMTDDTVQSLSSDIANLVGLMFNIDMDNDFNYVPLVDYITDRLTPFSNGYRNHN